MMQVGISTFGCDGGRSGIGRYAVNLIRHLARLSDPAEYHLCAFQDESHVFVGDPTPRVHIDLFPNWMKRPVVNIAWHQTQLAGWCRRHRHEVLFLPAGNRRLPFHAPCPTVGTVHDFSSLHVSGKYDAARMFYIKQVLPVLVRRLTHVLTISESSKRDIVEYAQVDPERITVTPLAVDHAQYQVDSDEAQDRLRAQFQLEQPYLLYVSRIEHPGKNHIRLIEAFERLKASGHYPHLLVLAGSDWGGAEEVHKRAARSPFADEIRFTGYIPDSQLVALYACAEMLVFPSLYEGFGLPLLEAMAAGTPIACANVSSLPEVGGDAATYFSPDDPDSIHDAICQLLDDAEYRQRSIRKGIERSRQFTWEATAQNTYNAMLAAARCPRGAR